MLSLRLERYVAPERLDVLPPDDPLARRSRRDLQRVHRAMRSLTILRRAKGSLAAARPQSILELGAGDGSLMLRFAQSAGAALPNVHVTFLDRQDLVSAATCRGFARLGWDMDVLSDDILDWVRAPQPRHYDLCITTLFLHHFQSSELRLLLRAVAERCRAFIALEPRRNSASWIGSHLLGFLGANEVTRQDGVTSVIAGFADRELTALWPNHDNWRLQEYFAWPFSHCFIAERSGAITRIEVPTAGAGTR